MSRYAVKEACFDEVFDSQKCFRLLMESMSRPGKVYRLQEHGFDRYPEGFNPWVLMVLKTLGDNNVTYYMNNEKDAVFGEYIAINTGMQQNFNQKADYAIYEGNSYDESFNALNPGTLEFPENSATAVISVDEISETLNEPVRGNAVRLYMSGPGVKDVNNVQIAGLDKRYVYNALKINLVFPLGIDLIFVDRKGNLTCMARTTKAEVK